MPAKFPLSSKLLQCRAEKLMKMISTAIVTPSFALKVVEAGSQSLTSCKCKTKCSCSTRCTNTKHSHRDNPALWGIIADEIPLHSHTQTFQCRADDISLHILPVSAFLPSFTAGQEC